MKKAQSSEFIGVVLLVVVLVIILLFSKIRSAGTNVEKTKESIDDFNKIYVATSVTKFPYITEKGIPLNELIGVYICYTITNADYGRNIGSIDIIDSIIKQLDRIYEKNNWKLELNSIACITSTGLEGPPVSSEKTCSPFPGKEYTMYTFMFPLPCKINTGIGKIYITTG
ncbi:hypothetical protein GF327_02200 [Candidatus Woesearchaeota archaeon]|nr:hypothetical protein [Candidatus Woesearchaeota archaeon]